MENVLIAIFAVAAALAFLSAMVALKERTQHMRFWWSAFGVFSFALSSAALLVLLLRMSNVPWGFVWSAVVVIALGLIFWIALLIGNYAEDHGDHSLGDRLRLAGRVCLPGWRSLEGASYHAQDVREASRINSVLNVGAAILVLPGVASVLVVAILMNIRDNQTSDFISHVVGYYALLLATSWTVAYLATILLISLVQVIRGNKSELTIGKVGVSLGTWAGFGAAGGVFVGTLVPLVVVPLAKGGFTKLGVSLLDSISPALLLDISTAGAVFGFLIGEVISLVSLSGGEENLYVKVALPPVLFAAITTVLGIAGLTPGKLSESLSDEYKKTVLSGGGPQSGTNFETAMSEGLDTQSGWANAVAGFDEGGWNKIVDHDIFYLATWIIALLVVLFAMTLGIRKREETLLKAFQEAPVNKNSAPVAGSNPAAEPQAEPSGPSGQDPHQKDASGDQ